MTFDEIQVYYLIKENPNRWIYLTQINKYCERVLSNKQIYLALQSLVSKGMIKLHNEYLAWRLK